MDAFSRRPFRAPNHVFIFLSLGPFPALHSVRSSGRLVRESDDRSNRREWRKRGWYLLKGTTNKEKTRFWARLIKIDGAAAKKMATARHIFWFSLTPNLLQLYRTNLRCTKYNVPPRERLPHFWRLCHRACSLLHVVRSIEH